MCVNWHKLSPFEFRVCVKSNELLPTDAQRIYHDYHASRIANGQLNVDLNGETELLDDNVNIMKQSLKHYSKFSYQNAWRLNSGIRWFWR